MWPRPTLLLVGRIPPHGRRGPNRRLNRTCVFGGKCTGSSETLLFISGSRSQTTSPFVGDVFIPAGRTAIKQVVLNSRRKHLAVEVCLEQFLWPREERARDAR
ncbi:hypothetical protein AWB68_08962 [Caballeronia choica]|jgi:hypothetical protein|uniref:Uncharacterized protein n=1 Tax=Caballeronia choica TaxID=326476 RepID=A0A158L7B9_9BURK|nr:hypothetical protein AWB68_08962 [Caballeronia choica]